MSDSELAVVAAQTFPAPILIERAGPSTRKSSLSFLRFRSATRTHGPLITARSASSWPGPSAPGMGVGEQRSRKPV